MTENTGNPNPASTDHRQPGPPPSVALRGAGTHDLDVLAGRLYGGESE